MKWKKQYLGEVEKKKNKRLLQFQRIKKEKKRKNERKERKGALTARHSGILTIHCIILSNVFNRQSLTTWLSLLFNLESDPKDFLCTQQ